MLISEPITLEKRNNLIFYIHEHFDQLSHSEKCKIAIMIYNSIERKQIKEKGTGVQIPYVDMPNSVIIWIYNFISSVMSGHT